MEHTCSNYSKPILSHTFDYGKEVDTSITLPYLVLPSFHSIDTFASTETIPRISICTYQMRKQSY